MFSRPLLVQSDGTILLNTTHSDYAEVRRQLLQFAENIKSPEYIHYYKISRLSLWNAAAIGWTSTRIVQILEDNSEYPVQPAMKHRIIDEFQKYGLLRLVPFRDPDYLLLLGDASILNEFQRTGDFQTIPVERVPEGLICSRDHRGSVKQACLRLGYPVVDQAGYTDGEPCVFQWKHGSDFLRPYQIEALDHFFAGGECNGVIVLPCGAGKTIVGIAAMQRLSMCTLILTPNATSAEQWKREILDRTTLPNECIGIYTSGRKTLYPVTIATYQMATYRKGETYPHLDCIRQAPWGFVIYDEVHLLPAPIFRLSADLQSRRRLGLTATLVREDGLEEEAFVMVGPKKYDVPWKTIEKSGWIAPARCVEVSIPFVEKDKFNYLQAGKREQHRLAAENPRKIDALEALLRQHAEDRVLVIGQYINQLQAAGNRLQVPVITGKTPVKQREEWFAKFRAGEIQSLVVSKVANVAVDMPCANVAIQISGTFGSRQEEAQRLGRILRPNAGGRPSYFYTLVTKQSLDQESSTRRQMFLTEQGYQYELRDFETLLQEGNMYESDHLSK
ncbi:DEAD/DEAH box helicase [Fodinisporobacter ferrooxydans]|uniref:DNA 3'-5' helicase n=1 Tax=Fodinisporobacter ferrooxydans TaxID=2901836 RepID=A0ABY4CH74_9BACL|nr:DEAD/DEAH box helicase [Alicyclobacillaceae bacterium MYW30-H2]